MNRTNTERSLQQPRWPLAAAAAVAIGISLALARPFNADAAGVTASNQQGTLNVNGTGADDIIIIRLAQNDPSTLEVDSGGDGQADFTFNVADIDAIHVSAKGGNDIVGFNLSNGSISIPASVDGGAGDDDLTGAAGNDEIDAGAGNDTANGGAGNDVVDGKAGNDRLFGGAGDDTLTGGTGTDELDAEAGMDRIIWKNGDETDRIEGGDDMDTVEVTGSSSNDTFTTTANGSRVRIDGLNAAPFALDIGTTEHLDLKMGGEADSFSAAGNLASLISLTIDGGGGPDTISGGNGSDVLIGGDGSDFIDGNQGNDTVFGGSGNDTFQWDPGDGSDVLEGEGGSDRMLFNGSNANEVFDISANGNRVRFARNIAAIVMDINDIETVELNILGGTDAVTVNPLPETGVTAVTVNAAGFGGIGDTQTDAVLVAGTEANDVFRATRTADSAAPVMTGFGTTVTLLGAEAAFDSLVASGLGGDDLLIVNDNAGLDAPVALDGGPGNDTVQVNGSTGAETFSATANGPSVRFDRLAPSPYAINISNTENLLLKAQDGDDRFTATGNLAPLIGITVDGGGGNDIILGSNGNDTLIGGAGDDFIDGQQGADTVLGGAGIDTFQWDPGDGSDTLDGQGGSDVMLFNGSAISENFEFTVIGGHVQFTRNVAAISLDLDGIESFELNALGGADSIVIHSLNGTELGQVNVNLAAPGGAGDAQADSVIVDGNAAKNVVLVSGDASVATVSGLKPLVNITGVEPENDRLTVNVLAGNDVVDASALTAAAILFTAYGGEGNDTLTGGAGNDTLFGEDGNDVLAGGPGLDILDGGAGSNTVTQD